jgi:hypothetical protein
MNGLSVRHELSQAASSMSGCWFKRSDDHRGEEPWRAIYEHSLPFNVSRAYDEVSCPRIWTAQRYLDMWAALQH